MARNPFRRANSKRTMSNITSIPKTDPNSHVIFVCAFLLGACQTPNSQTKPLGPETKTATTGRTGPHRQGLSVRQEPRANMSPPPGRDPRPATGVTRQKENLQEPRRIHAGRHQPKKVVVLVPLGQTLPKTAILKAKQGLAALYGFEMRQQRRQPLPAFAYYPPRRRYRADKILDFLSRIQTPGAFKVVGITAVDISTTKGRFRDWGVMGLGELGGRYAVVSMFRCRRGSRSAQHAINRFAKTVAHEVGHTLGLPHCPTRGCIMEDAKGTNKTTDREYRLCDRCRSKLQAMGLQLPPADTPLPWPKPNVR